MNINEKSLHSATVLTNDDATLDMCSFPSMQCWHYILMHFARGLFPALIYNFLAKTAKTLPTFNRPNLIHKQMDIKNKHFKPLINTLEASCMPAIPDSSKGEITLCMVSVLYSSTSNITVAVNWK